MDGVRKFKSHPQSAPGDFYVVNDECITCGAPQAVAPDLIGWSTDSGYTHCIWKKQPETQAEMVQAFDAFAASCVGCYRYAGTDPAVMERLAPEWCDYAPQRSNATVPRDNAADRLGDFHFTLAASAPSQLSLLVTGITRGIRSLLRHVP